MQPANLANAPRCGAKTRSGRPCLAPAVRGKRRCRMHGGTNRGAPKGNRHARVHGNRSAEAELQSKRVGQLGRQLRAMAKLKLGLTLTSRERDLMIQLWIEEGRLETAGIDGA